MYAGALSLCGAIGPSNAFLQRDFALRAAFDYYFPGLLGPLVPVPADYEPDERVEARIAGAFARNPAALHALLGLYPAADARSLVPVIAFITYDVKELQQRTRGNPFGNADAIYVGSGDDAALNDGVKRYRADAQAAAYIARWYTPSGKLLRPLLALHDTGDPLVPAIVRVRLRAHRPNARGTRRISCSNTSIAKATACSRPTRSAARSTNSSTGSRPESDPHRGNCRVLNRVARARATRVPEPGCISL